MSEIYIPKHAGSFSLTHNAHLDVYETVERHIEDRDYFDPSSFQSPEDRARCIETNELWTAHWYPNTPVGFCVLHASSLEVLNEMLKASEATP